MRSRYLLIPIIFVILFTAILVARAANFIPPRPVTQKNPPSGIRDRSVEMVGVKIDGYASISVPAEPAAPQVSTTQEGKSLVEVHCIRCHPVQWLKQVDKSRSDWKKTLEQMEAMGVPLEDSEKVILLNYLAIADEP